MHPISMRTEAPMLAPPRPHCLYVYIQLFICILYHFLFSKLVKVSVSLSSLSCCSELIESKERIVYTSDLWLFGQKHRLQLWV